MKIHKMEQYSDDWWAVRRNIPTASCADKILTPTGKISAQSRAYINTLIANRLGLGEEPTEPTEWMLRGTELEPEARRFYEFETGQTVEQVGFITNDEGTAGGSPDGLINVFTNRGGKLTASSGWEVKCPKASTHIGYLLSGELPAYYRPQVAWSMAVSSIEQWVFMSYHPELQPLIVEVEWNSYTDQVLAALNDFVQRLEQAWTTLGFDEAA